MKLLKVLILFQIIIFSFFSISCISKKSDGKDVLNSYGLPILQGTSGFGLDTKGGRGGDILVVSNLKPDGQGSLAEAVRHEGPRIIVFEVAGVINLEGSSLRITNPFITIAGQTAPSPGITIIKGSLLISTHNVIIQHLRVRPGRGGNALSVGWSADAISTGKGASNVIIDHCTTTWGTDETLSLSGPRFDGDNIDEWRKNTSHKVTISNCIIAQCLSTSSEYSPVGESNSEYATRYPSGDVRTSKGTLIHDNATEILIYGNLYADNMDRNPLCKGGSQTAIVNNYIFNPGRAAIHYGHNKGEWANKEWVTGKMTVEGNYIEYGPNTSVSIISPGIILGDLELFWEDNLVNDKAMGFKGTYGSLPHKGKGWNELPLMEIRPVWPEGLVPMPSSAVKEAILKNAGAFPLERDYIDSQLIERVRSGIGQYIDCESEIGGYPVIEPVYRKFNPDEWDLVSLTRK